MLRLWGRECQPPREGGGRFHNRPEAEPRRSGLWAASGLVAPMGPQTLRTGRRCGTGWNPQPPSVERSGCPCRRPEFCTTTNSATCALDTRTEVCSLIPSWKVFGRSPAPRVGRPWTICSQCPHRRPSVATIFEGSPDSPTSWPRPSRDRLGQGRSASSARPSRVERGFRPRTIPQASSASRPGWVLDPPPGPRTARRALTSVQGFRSPHRYAERHGRDEVGQPAIGMVLAHGYGFGHPRGDGRAHWQSSQKLDRPPDPQLDRRLDRSLDWAWITHSPRRPGVAPARCVGRSTWIFRWGLQVRPWSGASQVNLSVGSVPAFGLRLVNFDFPCWGVCKREHRT